MCHSLGGHCFINNLIDIGYAYLREIRPSLFLPKIVQWRTRCRRSLLGSHPSGCLTLLRPVGVSKVNTIRPMKYTLRIRDNCIRLFFPSITSLKKHKLLASTYSGEIVEVIVVEIFLPTETFLLCVNLA